MKLFNYLIPLLMIFIIACGEETTSLPVEGGLCSEAGAKACSESAIEVLQCGNDLTWHSVEICKTLLSQYCIEAAGTAYCNGGDDTSDEDTLQLPDKDAVTPDKDAITPDKDTVDADIPTVDQDITPDEENQDSDITETDDSDISISCGDGKVDEIFNDLKKEYANNAQVPIVDSDISASTITATQSGKINSFSYKFHIAHTRPADLKVALISPAGTTYFICLECTMTDIQNRDETITNFDGETGDGEWLLQVTDNTSGNTGMINYFRISMDLHVLISGEECDDGNDVNTDDCTNSCKTPVCGDGIIWDGHEGCDDINDGSYGNCNTDCVSLANHCGDGTITDGEICDDGADNGTYSHCTADCMGDGPYCGDGATTDAEVCDDGADNGTYNHCNATCLGMESHCGDNAIDATYEDCDDGNAITERCAYGETECTICDETCHSIAGELSVCGDNYLDTAVEECDDGNLILDDCEYGELSCLVCDDSCHSVEGATSYCGDNAIDPDPNNENCDDGNAITEKCGYGVTECTVCDTTCHMASGDIDICGDGTLDAGDEECDDGNLVVEGCDYGLTECTVCDATCHEIAGEPHYCGNGTVDQYPAMTNDADFNIPVNTDTYTVYSPVVVESDFAVTTVHYSFDIPHTCISDLQVQLHSPTGTVVQLFVRADAGCTNEVLHREGDLTNFTGESAKGTWNLVVGDWGKDDSGHLDTYTLTIHGPESCDDGEANGSYNSCASDCSGLGLHCGDGITTASDEICDDGVLNGAYDKCADDCSGIGRHCGDGTVDTEYGDVDTNYANETAISIPSYNTRYSDIAVADIGTINTFTYTISVTEGWGADVTGVTILAPDGTPHAVCSGYGCSASTMTGTAVISAFNGKTTNGTWRLKVSNSASSSSSGYATINYFRMLINAHTIIYQEACDDGEQNGEYNKCATDCSGIGLYCGDGVVTASDEVCDDGEENGFYEGCNTDCQGTRDGGYCGDGTLQPTDDPHLVLYLPLNATSGTIATDYSGHGNGGTLTGATWTTGGARSGALHFNGTTDFVDVGNPDDFKITGNQTIAMWIKPEILTRRQNPYNKAYGGEGTITLEDGASAETPKGTLNYFYGRAGSNNEPYQYANTTTALTANAWTHIALVRDLEAMTITWYVDGVESSSIASQYATAVASNMNLILGNGYAGFFQGDIDEVFLFSRALSSDEVLELKNTMPHTNLINETCDDGNTTDGDGCSSSCFIE